MKRYKVAILNDKDEVVDSWVVILNRNEGEYKQLLDQFDDWLAEHINEVGTVKLLIVAEGRIH